MPFFTHRIDRFRGINKSLSANALDLSYANEAVNVDIVGGRLTGRVGNTRLVCKNDIATTSFPNIFETDNGFYLVVGDKFVVLPSDEPFSLYPPESVTMQSVTNNLPDDFTITAGAKGTLVRIDNENMLLVPNGAVDGSGNYRTVCYYEQSVGSISCRLFGTPISVFNNLVGDARIYEVTMEDDKIKSITISQLYDDFTSDMIEQALTDGIFIFSDPIDGEVTDDDIDNAFWWFEATSVSEDESGRVVFSVTYEGVTDEILVGDYVYIRGGCSDMNTHNLTMYYNRLFSVGARDGEHPRRVYWSRLPGDGRTIEDWTRTEVSLDTSGGHVDVGDVSDKWVTEIFDMGSQLLIFTHNRLFRMYGYSPSNYTLDLVGNLEGTKISRAVDVNGTPYWLTLAGLAYYNGSYISFVDDNGNIRNILASFPISMRTMFKQDSVTTEIFDRSLMFAFNVGFGEEGRECVLLRYNMETGDVTTFEMPASGYANKQDLLTRIGTYETRMFHAVWKEDSISLIQWQDWGNASGVWYDGSRPKRKWSTGVHDLQTPEYKKKLQTVCLRGSGEFDLTTTTEVNEETLSVVMPNDKRAVRDITPHISEGRTFQLSIESEKSFDIEPYATLIFETGRLR